MSLRRLAIITARGGSKRIPGKNIRPFCGRPILAYSIDAAKDAGCFDEVMVSTDNEEIAEVARRLGAAVPFMRSPDTSDDHATTASVILEVLQRYLQQGHSLEYACGLYPTAPLIDGVILLHAFHVLEADPDLAAVVPLARFSYPIQRALRLQDGRISLFQPDRVLARSQDLEPAYHDAGQFYWVRVNSFIHEPQLLGPRTGAVVLPAMRVQDIDTEEDWSVAEAKYHTVFRKP